MVQETSFASGPHGAHLSTEQLESFREQGFLVLKDFVDPHLLNELRQDLVDVLAAFLSLEDSRSGIPDRDTRRIDEYYWQIRAMSEENRSVVYDLVKNLPGMIRLSSERVFVDIFKELFEGSVPCISSGGTGIRIDTHLDDQWASPMHQEFPFHMQSMRGLVVWLPLADVHEDMGPVDIWARSHTEGLLRLKIDDSPNPRSGVNSIVLADEQYLCERYERVSFGTSAGDVVLFDYMTVHASSPNRSPAPRWTLQWRLFDVLGPLGQQLKWRSGWSGGLTQAEIVATVNGMLEDAGCDQ